MEKEDIISLKNERKRFLSVGCGADECKKNLCAFVRSIFEGKEMLRMIFSRDKIKRDIFAIPLLKIIAKIHKIKILKNPQTNNMNFFLVFSTH